MHREEEVRKARDGGEEEPREEGGMDAMQESIRFQKEMEKQRPQIQQEMEAGSLQIKEGRVGREMSA